MLEGGTESKVIITAQGYGDLPAGRDEGVRVQGGGAAGCT